MWESNRASIEVLLDREALNESERKQPDWNMCKTGRRGNGDRIKERELGETACRNCRSPFKYSRYVECAARWTNAMPTVAGRVIPYE